LDHFADEHPLPECFELKEGKTWEELHEFLHNLHDHFME
jgi:hypothetical protein